MESVDYDATSTPKEMDLPSTSSSMINISSVVTAKKLADPFRLVFGEESYNTLFIGPLGRQHLKMLLTCEASNNNLTLPTSTVVMIDMNRECNVDGVLR